MGFEVLSHSTEWRYLEKKWQSGLRCVSGRKSGHSHRHVLRVGGRQNAEKYQNSVEMYGSLQPVLESVLSFFG